MERREPSEFSVTSASLDGSLVVSVSGELDLATASELEKVLAAFSGSEPVVVDLSALEFVDSSGLHVLLKKRPHGRPAAVVVAPDSHVARVFDIVGAGKSVFVCHDVQAAIRNVGQTGA